MGIPSYLEIISVIDHHKSTLATSSAPFAIISDAQSCNTLVAKQAFLINDRRSLLNQTQKGIEQQIAEHISSDSPQSTRLTQNLLQRRMIAKTAGKFFVHPEREFIEYLHFLYAIIDDTDLLSKVTPMDVECVAQLLNRMKSIASGRICELSLWMICPATAVLRKRQRRESCKMKICIRSTAKSMICAAKRSSIISYLPQKASRPLFLPIRKNKMAAAALDKQRSLLRIFPSSKNGRMQSASIG